MFPVVLPNVAVAAIVVGDCLVTFIVPVVAGVDVVLKFSEIFHKPIKVSVYIKIIFPNSYIVYYIL